MQATNKIPDNPALQRRVREYVINTLAHPQLENPAGLPTRVVLYIDGAPKYTYPGGWHVDTDYIYMAGQRTAGGAILAPMVRLSILSAYAGACGLSNDPTIQEGVMSKLTELIKAQSLNVYANLVVAATAPSRMALNPDTYQVAAELDGRWTYPSGAPAEVNNSWLIMTF